VTPSARPRGMIVTLCNGSLFGTLRAPSAFSATQDFTPVHHDKAAAQRQGLPDIIMNTMTTNGLVSRYVTDWLGPDAVLKRVALKLGAPNNPGDVMKMNGSVKAVDESAGVVEIAVSGTNSWGDHVTATVAAALPKEA